jgi:PAS domain S-box-containing protein
MESPLSKAKRSDCGAVKNETISSGSKRPLDAFFLTTINSLIILDDRFKYLYVNEQKAKMAGIKPSELIGKDIWLIFPKLIGKFLRKTSENQSFKEAFPSLSG